METQRSDRLTERISRLFYVVAFALVVVVSMGAAGTLLIDQIFGTGPGLPHIGSEDRYAGSGYFTRIQMATYTNDGECIIPVTDYAVTPVRSIHGSLDYDSVNDKLWLYGPAGSKSIDLN